MLVGSIHWTSSTIAKIGFLREAAIEDLDDHLKNTLALGGRTKVGRLVFTEKAGIDSRAP